MNREGKKCIWDRRTYGGEGVDCYKKTTIMVGSGNFAMLWTDNYHCSLETYSLTFLGERTEPEHLFRTKQKSDTRHEKK
jgi:hypothetical protein